MTPRGGVQTKKRGGVDLKEEKAGPRSRPGPQNEANNLNLTQKNMGRCSNASGQWKKKNRVEQDCWSRKETRRKKKTMDRKRRSYPPQWSKLPVGMCRREDWGERMQEE